MTHLLVASVAVAALAAAIALVFVLQRERPALRRIGAIVLLALGAALLVGILTA
ncbi:MAG: hypothetical protein AAF264_08295 [Pseudomonadota bacterium]